MQKDYKADDKGIMGTWLYSLGTWLALLILIGVACLFCGCGTTKYVPVETVRYVRTEGDTAKFVTLINSLRSQLVSRESTERTYISKEKERTTLNENGDTIDHDKTQYIYLSEKERAEYEQTIESLQDSIATLNARQSIAKTDSVSVSYPVERELTLWEKTKMDFGGMAIVAVAVGLLGLIGWLAIRSRRL